MFDEKKKKTKLRGIHKTEAERGGDDVRVPGGGPGEKVIEKRPQKKRKREKEWKKSKKFSEKEKISKKQ